MVEQGRIVERGTHDSLYALGGRYWDLYTRQHGLEANLFLAPGEGDSVPEAEGGGAEARRRRRRRSHAPHPRRLAIRTSVSQITFPEIRRARASRVVYCGFMFVSRTNSFRFSYWWYFSV